jgi:Uma2 family endonuclease
MVPERRKFTLEEYHRLGEMGFLGEDDRVELMDGEIIEMSPVGKKHNASINRNNRLLIRRLGDRAIVSVQNSVVILENEPLPDIAILQPNPTDYADRLATPEDILLMIEIADSSLAYDQEIKAPKYARAGVQELWVVDLNDDMVWVYRNPSEKGYLDLKAYQRGETITLLAFSDITLAVNDILGPQL